VDPLELMFEIVFFALAIPAFIGDVLAGVSDRARQIGRISTGPLMLLGGAAVNAISLAVGVDYADFADDAKFGWVTDFGEPSCRAMTFCLSDCSWPWRRPWE
jgi:hypothetical protein